MNIWEKLSQVDIDNKEKYQQLFSEAVKQISTGEFEVVVGEQEYDDHYMVVEENRMNAYFVHVVPKQVYALFKEMQEKAPQQFLGFSVLAAKHNDKDVRVSCFGVPCGNLGRSLLK